MGLSPVALLQPVAAFANKKKINKPRVESSQGTSKLKLICVRGILPEITIAHVSVNFELSWSGHWRWQPTDVDGDGNRCFSSRKCDEQLSANNRVRQFSTDINGSFVLFPATRLSARSLNFHWIWHWNVHFRSWQFRIQTHTDTLWRTFAKPEHRNQNAGKRNHTAAAAHTRQAHEQVTGNWDIWNCFTASPLCVAYRNRFRILLLLFIYPLPIEAPARWRVEGATGFFVRCSRSLFLVYIQMRNANVDRDRDGNRMFFVFDFVSLLFRWIGANSMISLNNLIWMGEQALSAHALDKLHAAHVPLAVSLAGVTLIATRNDLMATKYLGFVFNSSSAAPRWNTKPKKETSKACRIGTMVNGDIVISGVSLSSALRRKVHIKKFRSLNFTDGTIKL